MPIVVSVDLGTSKITALAVDANDGTIFARSTAVNDADTTSPSDRARGRSEWNAGRIVELGRQCLRDIAARLAGRRGEVVAVGITGQQHGMVLVDSSNGPLSPLINWQDRRGHDALASSGRSYLDTARDRLGDASVARTGCRLHPGFMGLTLFWMKQNGCLPEACRAVFIMDLFAAELTGATPVTEPSCAGSSGLFNVCQRNWDREAISALDLPPALFVEIREADQAVGALTASAAQATGLRSGTPVFAPIGDHQASFLGSVRNVRDDLLVNVGTGAQVAVYADDAKFSPPIELRPFPIRGNLLSNVGLAGGWSYQALEIFFQQVGHDLFQVKSASTVYETMNRLASAVPPGCDGLRCDPHFSGSRSAPTRRGAFEGVTPQNLTPGHFARAVLEGMARSLADGYRFIESTSGRSHRRVVAAGNALRENSLLRESVAEAFNLPLAFTRHREEAAFGAALTATVGAGVFRNLDEAASRIEYD